MGANVITEKQFKKLLKDKLGNFYPQAEKVFVNFGKIPSWDLTNVLLHAVDQGEEKTEEVLEILEEHYQEHLQYQHPDIRGTVSDDMGVNKTQVMFLNICQKVLGLQPQQS